MLKLSNRKNQSFISVSLLSRTPNISPFRFPNQCNRIGYWLSFLDLKRVIYTMILIESLCPWQTNPFFKIYGIFGFKGLLGSTFEYQKFYADVKHNFRLGLFGRLNYQIKAGYTPDILPYPLLENHLGNRTFFL